MNDYAAKYTKRDEASGCLLWTGATTHNGYGRITIRSKGSVTAWRAHRWFWEQTHGPIPKTKVVDHLCRTRSCVNTEHMRIVSPKENVLAEGSLAPSAVNKAKTRCAQGHALDEKRKCPVCAKRWQAAYRAKPEVRCKINADRRERYATDAKYRRKIQKAVREAQRIRRGTA